MKSWVKRFMRRGVVGLVSQHAATAIATAFAVLVSAGLLFLVHANGGLVVLLARAMASSCEGMKTCIDFNVMMLDTEAPIIVAAQIAVMLAKMARDADLLNAKTQTDLEDADLLSAVIKAGEENKKPC